MEFSGTVGESSGLLSVEGVTSGSLLLELVSCSEETSWPDSCEIGSGISDGTGRVLLSGIDSPAGRPLGELGLLLAGSSTV